MRALLGVGDLRRTQQGQVAHVGQRADVQQRVIRQPVAVFEPHLLLGGLAGQHGHQLARHPADIPLGELRDAAVAERACPRSESTRSSGGTTVGISS